jgi:hypothetical protein
MLQKRKEKALVGRGQWAQPGHPLIQEWLALFNGSDNRNHLFRHFRSRHVPCNDGSVHGYTELLLAPLRYSRDNFFA